MAKSDVLVRMKADVSNYDANIAKARRTLESFKQDNLTLGGVINQLTKSLTAAAAGFVGITAAASTISSLVSESVELAKAGEGIRLAFDRLNRPDLLANLKDATHGTLSEIELMKAAVRFDDFKLNLDDMGAMLAFAQQKAKDTGQSVDYMVESITMGLGRQSKQILDNLGISASEITKRMKDSGDMTKAVAEIIKEQMAEAGEYVETAADRAARAAAEAKDRMEQLGREAQPFAEAWAGVWNELQIGGMSFLTYVLNPIAESIQSIRKILNGEGFSFKSDIPNLANGPISPWAGQKPGTDHTVQAPGGYVEITDSNTGQVIGGKHFDNLDDTNAIKDWRKLLNKTPKTTSSTKKNVPSIGDFNKALRQSLGNPDDLKASREMLSPYMMMLPEIKKHILDIKDADLGGALAEIGNKEVLDSIEAVTLRYEQQEMAANLAAQAAMNLGSALSGIEDPGLRAAGTVMSAIANIALGFAMASKQADAIGSGWGWIAWLAAGTAAMATTISTIHSLTGYAHGGIVSGNSYSGDNIPIMANAGEVVLTKAAQASLANHLENADAGGGMSMSRISGEQIYVTLNRYLKRTGQGELVTW